MAQPASRAQLIDYAKRQLGAPVLEINVADEQVEDILDDSIQYFQERHFDGVLQTYLKYQFTQEDVDRGKGPGKAGVTGITTTTTSSTIDGVSVQFDWKENSNYLQVPPAVIGVYKVFRFDGANTATNNMFSVKYQLFLNDVAFNLGYDGLLSYAMTKTYLSDIDYLLTTEKQIRFNQRMDRLYLDIDWETVTVGDWLILDCFRTLDPNDYARVYNDSFLKKYFTANLKRQWGQNLIKFQGVQLPGGVSLNGEKIFSDAEKEIAMILAEGKDQYELPAMDMIG